MAGYSGTPLLKKLGVKEGFEASAHHAPDNYFELLGDLPAGTTFAAGADCDFIHGFYKERERFETELGSHLKAIKRGRHDLDQLAQKGIKGPNRYDRKCGA